MYGNILLSPSFINNFSFLPSLTLLCRDHKFNFLKVFKHHQLLQCEWKWENLTQTSFIGNSRAQPAAAHHSSLDSHSAPTIQVCINNGD